LAAILAVSQSLQELHKRLATSMMASTSDSAVDYVVSETEHTPAILALLKTKELQLQVEVNKCAELRAENVLLQKKLRVFHGDSFAASRQLQGYKRLKLHSTTRMLHSTPHIASGQPGVLLSTASCLTEHWEGLQLI